MARSLWLTQYIVSIVILMIIMVPCLVLYILHPENTMSIIVAGISVILAILITIFAFIFVCWYKPRYQDSSTSMEENTDGTTDVNTIQNTDGTTDGTTIQNTDGTTSSIDLSGVTSMDLSAINESKKSYVDLSSSTEELV